MSNESKRNLFNSIGIVSGISTAGLFLAGENSFAMCGVAVMMSSFAIKEFITYKINKEKTDKLQKEIGLVLKNIDEINDNEKHLKELSYLRTLKTNEIILEIEKANISMTKGVSFVTGGVVAAVIGLPLSGVLLSGFACSLISSVYFDGKRFLKEDTLNRDIKKMEETFKERVGIFRVDKQLKQENLENNVDLNNKKPSV